MNAVYFMDKHPEDATLRAFVRNDLRWYVLDDHGHWVKNGFENDVDAVIERCRAELRASRRLDAPASMSIRESV